MSKDIKDSKRYKARGVRCTVNENPRINVHWFTSNFIPNMEWNLV